MWCGLCGFYIIKPQTTLHHAVRCGYVILRAVLVQFLQFMQFGEHPYIQLLLLDRFTWHDDLTWVRTYLSYAVVAAVVVVVVVVVVELLQLLLLLFLCLILLFSLFFGSITLLLWLWMWGWMSRWNAECILLLPIIMVLKISTVKEQEKEVIISFPV